MYIVVFHCYISIAGHSPKPLNSIMKDFVGQ